MNPESGRVYQTQADLDKAREQGFEKAKELVYGPSEAISHASARIKMANRLVRRQKKNLKRMQKASRKANR